MSSSLLVTSFIKGIGKTSASLTVLGVVGSFLYMYSKSFRLIMSIDNQTQTETQSETESQTDSNCQTDDYEPQDFKSVFDRLT